jgi:DNA-binding XRE family transcriptional regulator
MKLKKTELAKRLNLRYATLLDWEKNRPEVYKRLVLSYEYERIINEMTDMLQKMQSNISHIKQGDCDGSCTKYGI